MAEGYVMTIPKSVLDKLNKADELIVKIGADSERTRDRVRIAFSNMANDVNPFIKKIEALKGLGSLKLDTTLKSSASAAERAASSVAQVATQLNKVAESPVDIINKKIESLRNLLNESTAASQRLTSATASGVISKGALAEGKAGQNLAPQINNQIYALQLEKETLAQNDRNWKAYIDNLNKASVASQRQQAEMDKLNASFRNGQSLLQKQAKAEDELGKASQKVVTALDKAAQAEQKKVAARNNQANQAAVRAEEQYARALNKSEVTITQRARKIEALANAQRALTQTGRDYSSQLSKIASETQRLQRANDEAAKSYGKIKTSQNSILNTSDQLERKLALLFSVAAVQGYVEKLIAVRGEFELQQRALQSILQNKEQADEIWSKTVQLAVRSPFTVKELVTYTKQLAAYRIEADKLYNTNKMLADVSAGLGVSMDRLILAFGQVKAANYLRASEVRQFTEAGVNMLGELANIYSELEGRMVSVGEVQDRITKRMVAFGDVEEVFKRITSAGGIFYNMQEVQAETLAGMISNLQDTFDLMFNDIGKANDGVLKSFVTLVKDIVNGWERIAQIALPIIETLILRWTVLKSITIATSLTNSKFINQTIGGLKLVSLQFLKTTEATKRLGASIKATTGASAFGGWLSILTAVAAITWEIVNAISAAKKEQKEFNKIILEGDVSASEMSQKFKMLADTAIDETKSAKEQKEALDELKRTYSDIIPIESLRIENLKAMKGNYDEVTNAIYAKIEASTREKLLSKVQENEGEKVADDLEDLKVALVKFGVTSATARQMVNQLKQDIESGLVKSPDEAVKRIRELISQYTLLDSTLYISGKGFVGWGSLVTKSTFEAFESMQKLKDKVDEINEMNIKPLMIGDIPAAKEIDSLFNLVGTEIEKWKEQNSDKLSLFELSQETKNTTISKYKDFIKTIKNALKGEGDLKLDERSFLIAQKYIEKAQKEIEKINGSKAQKEIEKIVISLYKLNGVNLDGVNRMLLGSEESIEEYTERVKNRIELLVKILKEYDKNSAFSPFDSEKIADQRKELTALQELLLKLPDYSKPKKGCGESEADKLLKKQISLLKEVGKEYEKNLRYYSKDEAAAKTRADYFKTFDEAKFPSGFIMEMSFDPSGIIQGIQEIGKQASKKMALEVERSISGIQSEVDLGVRIKGVDNIRQELEKYFSGYELSVQLEGLGLDKNVLNKLFNIDYSSLDDLKEKLNKYFPDITKLSKEQFKVYEYFQNKISEAEQKEYEKRLKMFAEYIANSVDKVKQVQNSGALEIKFATDFLTEGKLNAEQYATIIKNVTDKVNKEVSKINLDKFKQTPEYIQAMGDLSAYSASQLEVMIARIQQLINESAGSLNATDLKVYTDLIDKLQDRLKKVKSPFSKNAFSELKQLIQLQKDFNEETERYNQLLEKQKQAKENVANVKTEVQQAQNRVGIDASAKDDLAAAIENLQEANNTLNSANDKLNISQGKLTNISGKMGQIQGGMSTAMSMIDRIVTGIYQSINATIDIMNQFKELQESQGVDTTKGGWREVAQAGELLGNVNEKVMSSWNNFKSGNIAGAVADAVGSITTIFTTLNKQHDARREQKIQEEIKQVGKLQKAYERLGDAINNAYTIDTLNMSNENAQRNIQQQIQSYQNMIAAEEDKKDTDWDRIDEWKEAISDLQQQAAELQNQKIADLGGFGSGADMKSAAEEFASVWLDAYRETGDGLDALTDKWDEYINNVIMKQMALRGINKFLEPIMKQLDSMIGEDSYLSTDELDKLKEQIAETMPGLNEYFKTLAESFGVPQEGTTELSGLQKGIQGVTEETAGVIEAYLNSMRFFVADSNMQLQTIASFFSVDPTQNPLVSELMSQTRLLQSIDERLASVITSAGNHPDGGFAIKALI